MANTKTTEFSELKNSDSLTIQGKRLFINSQSKIDLKEANIVGSFRISNSSVTFRQFNHAKEDHPTSRKHKHGILKERHQSFLVIELLDENPGDANLKSISSGHKDFDNMSTLPLGSLVELELSNEINGQIINAAKH